MPRRFEEAVSIEIARADAQARALVPIAENSPPDPYDHLSGLRANFLAHLIATRDRLPQTLNLRRAAPDVAVGAYAPQTNATHPRDRSRLA